MKRELDKITDRGLKDFAETSEPGQRRSVIVELNEPPLDFDPRRLFALDLRPPSKPRAPVDPPALIDEEAALEMGELGSELAALVGLEQSDLIRLDAARAFVLSVTPKQLRAAVHLPRVGVIRPNRTHRTR